MPSFFSGAPNDTPSSDFSTTKALIPLRSRVGIGDREHGVEVGDPGVGDPPLDPVSTKSSPSRTARVFMLAASEPASGSDRQ